MRFWHGSCKFLTTMTMGIESLMQSAPRNVISAIKSASDKTGVDFDYLVNQAATESSFRPEVQAKTSSAPGLYQFIDQTWLSTVSKHGAKHGLGEQAAQIKQDFQGRHFVADNKVKQEILDLRKDPAIASLMAAEFASDNQAYLEGKTGKSATATDLYMSHFLGAGGASKFIKAMQESPYRPAAHLMPAAARANKHVFYHADGSPKNMTEIYQSFEKKFGEVGDFEVAQAKPEKAVAQDVEGLFKGYTRDISFERMYGNNVDKFVSALPQMPAIKGGDNFFDELMGLKSAQNQSLFLALTKLDVPK